MLISTIIRKCKYITLLYREYVQAVASMVEEHYDTPEYEGVLFNINTPVDNNEYLTVDDLPEHTRRIYYNLEHYESVSIHYNSFFSNKYLPWLRGMHYDEIWDFTYSNIVFYDETFDSVIRFEPLRYAECLKSDPLDIPKQYDLCHIGVMLERLPHRIHVLNDIQSAYEISERYRRVSMKFITGKPIKDARADLSNCRYVLDTLNCKPLNGISYTQNQARIFELIMGGYKILTESTDGVNYFPDLVREFYYPTDDVRDGSYIYSLDLLNILNEPYVDDHEEIRERYKSMTYRDEDFEEYKAKIIEQYKQ